MKDEALGYFDPRPWHQDRPQRPKVWGPETLRNYWGYGSERVIRGYQTIRIVHAAVTCAVRASCCGGICDWRVLHGAA